MAVRIWRVRSPLSLARVAKLIFGFGTAEMVARQLRTWIKGLKNVKPENVLFFRDGVGEGQFGLVVDTEVLAIKGATVLATFVCRS